MGQCHHHLFLLPPSLLGNPRLFSSSSLMLSSAAEVSSTTEVIKTVAEKAEIVLDSIPDRPTPLTEIISSAELVGESTLQSLGLATMWPSGRVQWFMEMMHVNLDMPWWGTIVISTIVMRVILFPVLIYAQRNGAQMAKFAPEMKKITEEMTEARKRGDVYEAQRLSQELGQYYKKHGINPLKSAAPIMAQIPIFMSMLFGLRGMTNLPVESMETGGFLWITDLTLADPYIICPLITSVSTFVMFRIAADGINMNQLGPIAKQMIKAIPIVMIPMIWNFPAAISLYWATTNIISVGQNLVLKRPAVRTALSLPQMPKPTKDKFPKKEKGFTETMRDSYDNWKVQADVADRRAFDEQQFRDAGTGNPRRTFKFDPTRPVVKK